MCHNCLPVSTTSTVQQQPQKKTAFSTPIGGAKTSFAPIGGVSSTTNFVINTPRECPPSGNLYGYIAIGDNTVYQTGPMAWNAAQLSINNWLSGQPAEATFMVQQLTFCISGQQPDTYSISNNFAVNCEQCGPNQVSIGGKCYDLCDDCKNPTNCDPQTKNCVRPKERPSICVCVPKCENGQEWNFALQSCACPAGSVPMPNGSCAPLCDFCADPTNCDPQTKQCIPYPASPEQCVCVDSCPPNQVYNPYTGQCELPCDCNDPNTCPTGKTCIRPLGANYCVCVDSCPPNQVFNPFTGKCECAEDTVPLPNGTCVVVCDNCTSPTNCDPNTHQCDPYVLDPSICVCVDSCPPNQVYNQYTGSCQVPCNCNNPQSCGLLQTCVPLNGQPGVCVCVPCADVVMVQGVAFCVCDCNNPTCSTGDCLPVPNTTDCACVPSCPAGTTWNWTTLSCEPTVTPVACPDYTDKMATCQLVGQVYSAATDSCIPLPGGCPIERYNPNTGSCCPIGLLYSPLLCDCGVPCPVVSGTTLILDYTITPGGFTIPADPLKDGNGNVASYFQLYIHHDEPGVPTTVFTFPPPEPLPVPGTVYYIPLTTGNHTIEIKNVVFPNLPAGCVYPSQTIRIEDIVPGICCTPVAWSGIYNVNEIQFDFEIDALPAADGNTYGTIDGGMIVLPDSPRVYYVPTGGGTPQLMAEGPFIGQNGLEACSGSGWGPNDFIPANKFCQGYWENSQQPGDTANPFIYDNTTIFVGNGGNATPPANHTFNSTPDVGKFRLYYRLSPAQFDANGKATIRIAVLPHRCNHGTVWIIQANCATENCTVCGGQPLPANECAPVNCLPPTIKDCYANTYAIPKWAIENIVSLGSNHLLPDPNNTQHYTGPALVSDFIDWLNNVVVPIIAPGSQSKWVEVTIGGEKYIAFIDCFAIDPMWYLWSDGDVELYFSQFLINLTAIKLTAIPPAGCNVIDSVLWYYDAGTWFGSDPTKNPLFVTLQNYPPTDITLDATYCGCLGSATYTNNSPIAAELLLAATVECIPVGGMITDAYRFVFEIKNNGTNTIPAGTHLYIDAPVMPAPLATGTGLTTTNGTVSYVPNVQIDNVLGTDLAHGDSFTITLETEGQCSQDTVLTATLSLPASYTDSLPANNTAIAQYSAPLQLSGDLGILEYKPASCDTPTGRAYLHVQLDNIAGSTLPAGSTIKILLINAPSINSQAVVTGSGGATASTLGNLITVTLTAPLAAGSSLQIDYDADHNCKPINPIIVQITSYPLNYTDMNNTNDSYNTLLP